MKKLAMLTAAIVFAAAPFGAAAEKTWDGVISDARCNGKHSKAEHGSQAEQRQQCVTKCIAGGRKYVFVSGRQDLPDREPGLRRIKAHGGHKVALTGEMKGETITVSKIDMPKADTASQVGSSVHDRRSASRLQYHPLPRGLSLYTRTSTRIGAMAALFAAAWIQLAGRDRAAADPTPKRGTAARRGRLGQG